VASEHNAPRLSLRFKRSLQQMTAGNWDHMLRGRTTLVLRVSCAFSRSIYHWLML